MAMAMVMVMVMAMAMVMTNNVMVMGETFHLDIKCKRCDGINDNSKRFEK